MPDRSGIVIISPNCQDVVLVKTKRSWEGYPGKWGFPKGHQEPKDNGDFKFTALRETFEETGLTEKDFDFFDYNFQSGDIILYYAKLKKKPENFEISKEATTEIENVKLIKIKDIIDGNDRDLSAPLKYWRRQMGYNSQVYRDYEATCDLEQKKQEEKILSKMPLTEQECKSVSENETCYKIITELNTLFKNIEEFTNKLTQENKKNEGIELNPLLIEYTAVKKTYKEILPKVNDFIDNTNKFLRDNPQEYNNRRKLIKIIENKLERVKETFEEYVRIMKKIVEKLMEI